MRQPLCYMYHYFVIHLDGGWHNRYNKSEKGYYTGKRLLAPLY